MSWTRLATKIATPLDAFTDVPHLIMPVTRPQTYPLLRNFFNAEHTNTTYWVGNINSILFQLLSILSGLIATLITFIRGFKATDYGELAHHCVAPPSSFLLHSFYLEFK